MKSNKPFLSIAIPLFIAIIHDVGLVAHAALFCPAVLRADQGFSQARSAKEESSLQSQKSPMQVMVRPLRGKGGLQTLIDQLPIIAKTTKVLLLTGLHPQTVEQMPDGKGGITYNTFGYWPSSHDRINPEVGTPEQLKELIAKAKTLGLQVFIDAVPAHFGYAGEKQPPFVLNGIEYRKVEDLPPGTLRSEDDIQDNDWKILEESLDAKQVLGLWDNLFSKRQLFGLLGFDHQNKDVQRHLIDSYKQFIDMGAEGFRIDAALYIERHFLTKFINELSAYSRSQGRKLTFFLELLPGPRDFTMKTLAEDIRSRLTNKDEVFFFDFALMWELRAGVQPYEYQPHDQKYQLKFLKGFLEHRRNLGMEKFPYLGTLVNHDFGYPIEFPERELVLYALTDFVSGRSALLLQGTEDVSNADQRKPVQQFVNPNGRVVRLNIEMDNHLQSYKNSSVQIEILNDRTIALIRKQNGKSLVLIAGMDQPGDHDLSRFLGGKYQVLLKSEKAEFRQENGKPILKLDNSDFMLFEVETLIPADANT